MSQSPALPLVDIDMYCALIGPQVQTYRRTQSCMTLPDVVESLELHHPVRLAAQLHHQPVVGQVGDVVAGLPDGHLDTGLDCAVLLKPPGLLSVSTQRSEIALYGDQ